MQRIRPRVWGAGLVLSTLFLGVTYIVGIFSGGIRIDKACASAGQPLDDGYPSVNWPDPNPLFPVSKKCNASYDLVPFWINPALVIFALLTLACIVLLIVSLVHRAKTRRAESPDNENS